MQENPENACVSYTPCILQTLADICKVMGVGRKRVKNWIALGAPIAVTTTGSKKRYSAEAAALQAWRVKENQ